MYNDGLDMLPDADVEIRKPPISEFFADLRQDPIRWRANAFELVNICRDPAPTSSRLRQPS